MMLSPGLILPLLAALGTAPGEENGEPSVASAGTEEPSQSEDELEDLRRRVQLLEQEQEAGERLRAELGGRTSWWQELSVGVHGNIFGQRNDHESLDSEGREVADRIRVRKVDIDFASPLGPHAEAFVIAALDSDPVNEFDGELEEGHVTLRLFEDSAWPVTLKGGKMRSSFGRNNTWRLFELPQPTRPLVVTEFLGPDGFKQSGGAISVDLPLGSEAHDFDLNLELLGTGDIEFVGFEGRQGNAILLDLDWHWRCSESWSFLSGVSGYTGRSSDKDYLAGVDFLASYDDGDANGPRTFQLGGELMLDFSDRDDGRDDPMGGYAWTQWQVVPDWFVGMRFDYVERVRDPELDVAQGGVYFSWRYSERLRFTLAYEHAEGDERPFDGRNDIYAEVNFSLGANPFVPFWTGRRSAR